ncbi:MAG: NlpC/P60 family protein [Lachnospiraceae bacterium]
MKTKKLVAVLLVVAMGFSQFSTALADKKSDAQKKKTEAEAGLEKKQEEIDKIDKQQHQLQSEIDALDSELVQVILNLSTLEEELSIKHDDLSQTQANLEQAKVDEQNQYEAMKKRIRFMYERGDSSFMTSILESKSITDLLNKVEYFNEVYDYDRTLLVNYQTTKLQVQALEQQQQEEVQALEGTQQKYQAAAENYQATIASKSKTVEGFKDKLVQAQALAASYQNTISDQNTIIAKAEAEEKAAREKQAREKAAKEEAARQKAAADKANAANGNGSGGSHSGGGSSSGGSSSGGNSSGGSSSGGGSTGTTENLNPGYATGVSGSEVVSFALSFQGNPYVWGGKDPNTGADCSGFTSYVYGHFGINIPSYSYDQRSVGKEVSYSNAQPGDLICYAGHVAIYMGNGQIVHAKGTAYGIVANDNATYRSIITVRRVL